MLACGERHAMVIAPPPMHDSGVSPCFHGCLAFWLPSIDISPPWSPPSHPLDVSLGSQQQPSHWDCSRIPKLQLPAATPSRGPASLSRVCMAVSRTVWFIPFRLPQISCFTLSLKCLSCDSDNCPTVRIRPLLQFPHLLRVDPVLLILMFFPLVSRFYQVLLDCIYSFPLARYSCLLSAGVLHALLCLKLYSWCICGERCTPCPPTPPPSCYLSFTLFSAAFASLPAFAELKRVRVLLWVRLVWSIQTI